MNTFDPTKPITPENWPLQLRMPPKKRALEKPKPEAPPEEHAPWWSD